MGGPQLQHQALIGFIPEILPLGSSHSTLVAQINTGLGFLEAVSDADIMAMADPIDKDNDGISGVVNWIELPDFVKPMPNSISKEGKYIGRFGRKAGAYNLFNQAVNACNRDMGIVSFFHPSTLIAVESPTPK